MISGCNLKKLEEEIERNLFSIDGSLALMAYQPSAGIPDLTNFPEIKKAVDEISKIRNTPPLHLMINILPPGVDVPQHRDWILPTKHQKQHPTVERWHLPVKTNPQALYWNEYGGEQHMPLGKWFGPISYWTKHKVWNMGKESRIHIVVDLDTPHPIGVYE